MVRKGMEWVGGTVGEAQGRNTRPGIKPQTECLLPKGRGKMPSEVEKRINHQSERKQVQPLLKIEKTSPQTV